MEQVGWNINNRCIWVRGIWMLFFFFLINLFIYLFIYFCLRWVCCCELAFSSCGKQGLLFVVVHRLIVVTSLVAEHGLQ